MNDLRYSFRSLLRMRGVAAVAVVTLALGIGATTTMFSAAYAALLRPLPFADADRLVRLRDEITDANGQRHRIHAGRRYRRQQCRSVRASRDLRQ